MSWKKWFKLLWLFLFLGLTYFFLRSDFWVVKEISCRLDNQDCPVELWNQVAGLSLGKNLIFFPSQAVKEEIGKVTPQVGQIKIKKIIFNRLFFEIDLKKPLAVLGIELPFENEATAAAELKTQPLSLTGQFYLVDQNGLVLAKPDQQGQWPLVLLKNDPGLSIGQRFQEPGSEAVLKALLGLKMRLAEPKVIRLVSLREIEVWLNGETIVLLNGEKDLSSQLDSLQLILSRSKIEGKQIKKIDLRFDKPVIL
ncbi:cell division protein FtsQ [Candidatus Shapirobacteria bacterium]|nr:cell division protein FtsQ [Candidatus Shapirobacteria bacterium]